MQVKTKAIVLNTVRYQEKSLIVKCFTKTHGIVSFFIPSAFSTKKNNQKIAYFQPLTILDIESNFKKKGTLEYLKEIKIATLYKNIPFHIKKSSITLFLAEILHLIIREEEENENLYLFLETALIWLDTHSEITNFHLIFLTQLTKFLGFYPIETPHEAYFFDLKEGCFVPHASINALSKYQSTLFIKLMELRFDTPTKIFNSIQRQELLTILLQYYSIHLTHFKKPKSLEIFRELFS